MPLQPTHVIDTSALIAYLKGEQGHEIFADLVRVEANILAMHAINFCELYYHYRRYDGHERAELAWTTANEIVTMLDPLTEQFVKRIGRWKVEQNLGLGDAIAAATAEEYGCPLVTTDHNDFSAIDTSGALEILWLR